MLRVIFVFFFKQKTAYEMRISDWSSDVCSSDLSSLQSDGSTASGNGAVALGQGQTATGNGAVAIGDPNVATGTGAVAIGADNQAIGDGAVALGKASRDRKSVV